MDSSAHLPLISRSSLFVAFTRRPSALYCSPTYCQSYKVELSVDEIVKSQYIVTIEIKAVDRYISVLLTTGRFHTIDGLSV